MLGRLQRTQSLVAIREDVQHFGTGRRIVPVERFHLGRLAIEDLANRQ